MGRVERALVIATLCVVTGIGWQMGRAQPGGAAAMVSIRTGSVPTSGGAAHSTRTSRSRRSHVGGGFHGGK